MSNIDHHFKLAGFHNVFEMEGNWFEAVCSKHPKGHPVYHLASKIHDIYEKDRLGTLKESDLPTCNQCGASLQLNLPGYGFRINRQWLNALQNFIKRYENQKLVIIELGIGPKNQLIKDPSMRLIEMAPHSRYITINQGHIFIPNDIADRSRPQLNRLLKGYSQNIVKRQRLKDQLNSVT